MGSVMPGFEPQVASMRSIVDARSATKDAMSSLDAAFRLGQSPLTIAASTASAGPLAAPKGIRP